MGLTAGIIYKERVYSGLCLRYATAIYKTFTRCILVLPRKCRSFVFTFPDNKLTKDSKINTLVVACSVIFKVAKGVQKAQGYLINNIHGQM